MKFHATLIEDDVLHWLMRHQWLAQQGEEKFHAALFDPPYFLGSIANRFGGATSAPAQHGSDGAFRRLSKGFMNQQWDGFQDVYHYQAWVTEWASRMLDFMLPNAVLVCFGGTRTYHRLVAGLEDAGWIIFDTMMWVFGQGLPKAHDVDGYKTALKPAYEPIVLARAPRRNTFAHHFHLEGTGLLDINSARIEIKSGDMKAHASPNRSIGVLDSRMIYGSGKRKAIVYDTDRYPTHLILDGAAAAALNERSGKGDVARYFYQAKASTWEREAGLEDFEASTVDDGRKKPIDNAFQRGETIRRNHHPTIKPIQLIEYLARLLLPPERSTPRRLLIPFAGTGSEIIGAQLAGWDEVVGIERDSEYARLNRARCQWWAQFASYDEAARSRLSAHRGEATFQDQIQNGQMSLFEI